MEPETNNEVSQEEIIQNNFNAVTPLSKYLAAALFIVLPFVGGWVGYHYAPEKIIEVEKVVEIKSNVDMATKEESVNTTDWVTFSNSDGVYKIKHPPSWKFETETFYNYERFELVDENSGDNRMVFSVGFIANPRYTDEFGYVDGRDATYGKFDACIGEGGQGPECILTIVNVPLTPQETAEVRTDTSTDDEWLLEVTYGVSTEEMFSIRNEEIYLRLKEFYAEQEPLLKEVLNSLEFVDKNTLQ